MGTALRRSIGRPCRPTLAGWKAISEGGFSHLSVGPRRLECEIERLEARLSLRRSWSTWMHLGGPPVICAGYSTRSGLERKQRDVTEITSYYATEYESNRKATSIIDAVADPHLFANHFPNPATWTAWRVLLAALFGHPLSQADLEVYRRHTGRTAPPSGPFAEDRG